MQISKESWHYKFMRGWLNEYNIPQNFCPYMRKLIASMVFVLATTIILSSLVINAFYAYYNILTQGFQIFSKTHPQSAFFCVVLTSIICLLGVLYAGHRIIAYFSDKSWQKHLKRREEMRQEWEAYWASAIEAWQKAGHSGQPNYKEHYEKFYSNEKEPGVFKTYFAAVHNKICPTVEFT